MNPHVLAAGSLLKAGALKVARGLRAIAAFGYHAAADYLGPAIGTEYDKLHVQDLLRSIVTATISTLGFTTGAQLFAYVLGYFVPLLAHLAAGLTGPAGILASILVTLVLDLIRRLGQQSPVPIPVPAMPPPITANSSPGDQVELLKTLQSMTPDASSQPRPPEPMTNADTYDWVHGKQY